MLVAVLDVMDLGNIDTLPAKVVSDLIRHPDVLWAWCIRIGFSEEFGYSPTGTRDRTGGLLVGPIVESLAEGASEPFSRHSAVILPPSGRRGNCVPLESGRAVGQGLDRCGWRR